MHRLLEQVVLPRPIGRNEFIDSLRAVETELDVAEWRVNGMRVWPLVRLTLFANAFNAAVASASISDSRWKNALNVGRTLRTWASATLRDMPKNRSPDAACDVLFLAYSNGSQPVVGGLHLNPLLAPYAEFALRAERRVSVWEMAPHSDYNIPRYTPSYFVQPRLLYWRLATFRPPPKSPRTQLEGFDEFLRRVSTLGVEFRYHSLNALIRDATFVRTAADGFVRWLERAKPKIGFIADYGPREQAFCLACRELGITTVDIQHGVQGELHPAYGGWHNVPPGGYETRPQLYWTRDERSAAAINRWATRPNVGCRAFVGGNAFAEQWQDPASELAARFGAELESHISRAGGSTHILVSLDSLGDVIPDRLLGALRVAPEHWCFWLRLHPVNQRTQSAALRVALPQLRTHLLDWRFASSAPLPPLLRRADAHLSVSWSSVIDEAAEEGVPSVACAIDAEEVFPERVASGLLRTATSADEIVQALAIQIARGKPKLPHLANRGAAAFRQLLDQDLLQSIANQDGAR